MDHKGKHWDAIHKWYHSVHCQGTELLPNPMGRPSIQELLQKFPHDRASPWEAKDPLHNSINPNAHTSSEIVKPGATFSCISLECNTEPPTQENSKYECGHPPPYWKAYWKIKKSLWWEPWKELLSKKCGLVLSSSCDPAGQNHIEENVPRQPKGNCKGILENNAPLF